jgi:hypothetical protein
MLLEKGLEARGDEDESEAERRELTCAVDAVP